MKGFRPTKWQIAIVLILVSFVRCSGMSPSASVQSVKRASVPEETQWEILHMDDGYGRTFRIRGGGGAESKRNLKKRNDGNSESSLVGHPFFPIAITVFDSIPTMVVEVESFFRDRVSPRIRNARETFVQKIVDDHRGGEIDSFFRDRVLPRARTARERFVQGLEDHRERKARERAGQLERNELWRKAEQQHAIPVASPSSKQNRKNGKVSVSSYATSSYVSESSRALNSSSLQRASLNTVLLPTRVLKLSLLAFLLAEALDRVGILYEDTPELVRSRIRHFWRFGILRAYANIRSRLGGWYSRYLRRWISELVNREARQGIPRESGRLWWHRIGHRPTDGPAVWSSTKVAFAAGAACGMIGTPLLFSYLAKLWRPVLLVVGIAETNHCFKTRGRKFVELLGDTPQTLGATLDELLETCRQKLRRLVNTMMQSRECYYYEGYGSGSRNSGSVDDRCGDTTRMELMGADGEVLRIKKKHRKNSNSVDYCLGISADRTESNNRRDATSRGHVDVYNGWHFKQNRVMRDFDRREDWTIEDCNSKRSTMAKQGFVVGCAIGLAIKGV